jgi:AraC-like DNA-binding protein
VENGPRRAALAASTGFRHVRSVSDRELHATSLALRWAALAGLSADAVIEEAQLGADPLGGGGIPHRDGMKLWAAMETLTHDPFVGLTVGARATLDLMGVIGPLFATASSLGAGLEVFGQVLPLAIRNAVVSWVVEDEVGAIDYVMPDASVRHGVDAMFAAILVLAQQCATEPSLRPSYVEHQSPCPDDPSRYVACFGCLPRFDAPRCRLAFRREDLGLPFRGSEPQTAAVLRENAAKLLAPVDTVSLMTRVERALTESLAEGDGSLTRTAEKLLTSPRTLQRRLDEHGLEFESVRLELRKKLALRYLGEGLSVTSVAALLAYSSRASFTRAFTAWTGHPPTGRSRG